MKGGRLQDLSGPFAPFAAIRAGQGVISVLGIVRLMVNCLFMLIESALRFFAPVKRLPAPSMATYALKRSAGEDALLCLAVGFHGDD